VNFEDDPIATAENVPPLLALYTRATLDIHWHRPQDYAAKTVGHLGFFRNEHEAQWQSHLAWLREQAHANPH
jgi:predicted alpha/beta hydrolase